MENLTIANHCGICINYTASHGSSMKCQDGHCKLHEFLVHSKLICKDFVIKPQAFITRLNKEIGRIYGNTK